MQAVASTSLIQMCIFSAVVNGFPIVTTKCGSLSAYHSSCWIWTNLPLYTTRYTHHNNWAVTWSPYRPLCVTALTMYSHFDYLTGPGRLEVCCHGDRQDLPVGLCPCVYPGNSRSLPPATFTSRGHMTHMDSTKTLWTLLTMTLYITNAFLATGDPKQRGKDNCGGELLLGAERLSL